MHLLLPEVFMLLQSTENTLCSAIKGKQLVKLKYDDDFQWRTFAPHIVYRSSKNNILVSGEQVQNPAKPYDNHEPRVFDLKKIKSLEITDASFTAHPNFDPFDKRYRFGVICKIGFP